MIGCCAALLLPRELRLHRSQVLFEFYKLRRGLHALRNSPLEGGQGGVVLCKPSIPNARAVFKFFQDGIAFFTLLGNTPPGPLKGGIAQLVQSAPQFVEFQKNLAAVHEKLAEQ